MLLCGRFACGFCTDCRMVVCVGLLVCALLMLFCCAAAFEMIWFVSCYWYGVLVCLSV